MKIEAGISLSEYSLQELRYSQLVAERGYAFSVQSSWDHTNPHYQDAIKKFKITTPELVIEVMEGNVALLYEKDGIVALIDFSRTKVVSWVAAADRSSVEKHIRILKTLYVPAPDSSEDRVKIRFWYATEHGPRNVTREILVPRWDNIVDNYHPSTYEDLRYLMHEFKPSAAGGQLLIFYGKAGTGKSYSLRALLHSWKDWCTPEYILDPENLFGGSQGYMADLVLRGSSEYDEEEPNNEQSGKWKLLILEDSGELLSADAKSRTGQGLSRLLNLVDGLIGQGLRVLVLITTNEELQDLHPAVAREGRCAAAVNYKPFDRFAAQKWLVNKKDSTVVLNGKSEYTLADLFALTKESKSPIRSLELREVGFKIRA